MDSAQTTLTSQQATEAMSSKDRPSTHKIFAMMRDDFCRDRQLLRRDVRTITAACKDKALRQAQKVYKLFGSENSIASKTGKDAKVPGATLQEVRNHKKPTKKLVTPTAPPTGIAKTANAIPRPSEETSISPFSSPGQSSNRSSSTYYTEITTPGGGTLNDATPSKRTMRPLPPVMQALENPGLDHEISVKKITSVPADFTADLKRKVVDWFKSTHNDRLHMPEEERIRLRGITVLLLMIAELCFANPSHDQFRGGKPYSNNTERVACILEKASTSKGQNIVQEVFRNFSFVEAEYPPSIDTRPILTATLLQKHRKKHDPPAAIFLWAALVAALDHRWTNTAGASEALLRLVLPDQNVTELVQRMGSADKTVRRLSENEYTQLSDKLRAILDPDSNAIKSA